MMKTILRNERGFMLLNTVFLTLITAFAATILLNAAPRVKNPQSVLRLTAIHLANEQFALMESRALAGELEAGNYPFAGNDADLTTENAGAGKPVIFDVATRVTDSGNLRGVKVTVSWTFGGDNFMFAEERTIRVD